MTIIDVRPLSATESAFRLVADRRHAIIVQIEFST
jgi:hypothetical protein